MSRQDEIAENLERVKAKIAAVAAPVAVAAIAAPVVAITPSPKISSKPAAKAKPTLKDDLKLIKGIGPVNEAKLNKNGVHTFAQIAAWKKTDIVKVERDLEFDGRIAREDWVGQSKKLARDVAKAASSKGRK